MSEFKDMYYFGIITVSTSRFYSEKAVDESGLLASAIIRNSGYKVCCRSLVPDDKLAITGSLTSMLFNFKPSVPSFLWFIVSPHTCKSPKLNWERNIPSFTYIPSYSNC